MENFNTKKFFLYLLTCSIALSALMGIWAIVSGEFGELQGRILATTTTVVGTSILGLACGAYFEKARIKKSPTVFVPILGIALSIVSAAIILWAIWGSDILNGEVIWKILSISLIFAFSFAQLSLLSLARLAARFRWATIAAYTAVLTLATTVSLIILFSRGEENTFVFRFVGVLAVVDAAVTVMIPIFHRLSRTAFVEVEITSTEKIDAEIANLQEQIARLEKQKANMANATNAS